MCYSRRTPCIPMHISTYTVFVKIITLFVYPVFAPIIRFRASRLLRNATMAVPATKELRVCYETATNMLRGFIGETINEWL